MNASDIVRRLNEACTGGLDCQCTYRVAADDIQRLRDTNVKLVDQIAVLQTEKENLQSELASLRIFFEDWKVAHSTVRLEVENAALRDALRELALVCSSAFEPTGMYCKLCNQARWLEGESEIHAPGCLAAKETT